MKHYSVIFFGKAFPAVLPLYVQHDCLLNYFLSSIHFQLKDQEKKKKKDKIENITSAGIFDHRSLLVMTMVPGIR